MRAPHSPASYGAHGSSLRDLPRLRNAQRRRESSWDRSGGNDDFLTIGPGETARLGQLGGAGSICHIWCTAALAAEPHADEAADMLRRLLLRITWDEATEPSVLAPLGDFFGVGFARTVNFASLPLQMSPKDGRGFNCFFHMPFAQAACLELVSEMEHEAVKLYYYIDWEAYDSLDADLGRFHAQWRREDPTDGVERARLDNDEFQFGGSNLTGAGNYTILDAEGRGHYVGCVLNIHNTDTSDEWNWYGEGDDMIFIDGESFPPTLHGTGTEDYFNTAWCPSQEYAAPYHGFTLAGGENWSGQVSMYRFHVEDPIMFKRSIRVTIEHGHANRRSDDWSSVAYWYQELPHRPFGIAPVAERLPRRA